MLNPQEKTTLGFNLPLTVETNRKSKAENKLKLEDRNENETGIKSRKRKWSCYVNSTMRVNNNPEKLKMKP